MKGISVIPQFTYNGRELSLVNGKFVPRVHGASNINGPIPSEWAPYVTQSNVGLEVIPGMLYDTQTYVDTTTTNLEFFSAIPANLSISNVNPPRVLPNPESFLIQSIRIYIPVQLETIDQGAVAVLPSLFNDMLLLTNTGICNLTIGQKPYGPWPMFTLPCSTGPKMSGIGGGGAEAANVLSLYGNTDGPLYPLIPNLLIAPLQQFSVNLSWPAGAVNLTANRDIKVILDGQRSRAIS